MGICSGGAGTLLDTCRPLLGLHPTLPGVPNCVSCTIWGTRGHHVPSTLWNTSPVQSPRSCVSTTPCTAQFSSTHPPAPCLRSATPLRRHCCFAALCCSLQEVPPPAGGAAPAALPAQGWGGTGRCTAPLPAAAAAAAPLLTAVAPPRLPRRHVLVRPCPLGWLLQRRRLPAAADRCGS